MQRIENSSLAYTPSIYVTLAGERHILEKNKQRKSISNLFSPLGMLAMWCEYHLHFSSCGASGGAPVAPASVVQASVACHFARILQGLMLPPACSRACCPTKKVFSLLYNHSTARPPGSGHPFFKARESSRSPPKMSRTPVD